MLDDPEKKEIAMQIVASNENSTLNWKEKYSYIEDIDDGRGYTAGIIGFCSGTGDMLELVEHYTAVAPGNNLSQYIPALEAVNDSDSHEGLDPGLEPDWIAAAEDVAFQEAQNHERDRVYFDPAVAQGSTDGLGTLGQFIYYDALVMHGPGDDPSSFGGMREAAMQNAATPARGGDEADYLHAFLNVRVAVMENEPEHIGNIDRIETEQRPWVDAGNLNLDPPLTWTVNRQPFEIR